MAGRIALLFLALGVAACGGGGDAEPRAKTGHAQDLTEQGPSNGGCRSSDDCDDGEYCAFSDGACLDSDAEGFCKPLDTSCPAIDEPLCGCDGATYPNGCEAGRAGVSIAYEGACAGEEQPAAPPPDPSADCGGQICGDDQFCSVPDGQCGSAAGVCADLVGACTDKLEKVCGCDGKTYDGRCEARLNGTSVAHVGGC